MSYSTEIRRMNNETLEEETLFILPSGEVKTEWARYWAWLAQWNAHYKSLNEGSNEFADDDADLDEEVEEGDEDVYFLSGVPCQVVEEE